MTTAKFTRLNTTALFLGSVAALLAGASTASFAADTSAPNASPVISAPFSPATRSVKVSYRDLNLATPAGNRALQERISAAARKVCAVDNIRVLDEVAAAEACQSKAVSHALEDVHASHPTADYALNLTRR